MPIHVQPISNRLGDKGDFTAIVNKVFADQSEERVNSILSEIISLDLISVAEIVQQTNKKGTTNYLNLTIDQSYKNKYNASKIENILSTVYSDSFGIFSLYKGNVVVEHTSANPIAPLHVGNLRNSIQGDTFARILQAGGYNVYRHFLINDGGLQIAFTVLGYSICMKHNVNPPIKFDLWIGQVYAIMNSLYRIEKIKNDHQGLITTKNPHKIMKKDVQVIEKDVHSQIDQLQLSISDISHQLEMNPKDKGLLKQKRELDRSLMQLKDDLTIPAKLFGTQQNLSTRFPDLYKLLATDLKGQSVVGLTQDYIFAYENQTDKDIINMFRSMTEKTIASFEWTLKRYNIMFDTFDYESDVTWSKKPETIISSLKETPDVHHTGEKSYRMKYPLDKLKTFYKDVEFPKERIMIKGQVPDLQLTRSDGTALYPAKDIAYSIQKFEHRSAARVYNVIGSEQITPLFQLLYPLYLLNLPEYAQNMIHYPYEMVQLVGRKMSGRLANYITSDEYFDETYIRARMAKRTADAQRGQSLPQSEDEWETEHLSLLAVTLASTRFPLIETSPTKKIELDLDRELDFKQNSGPFVQYAHARANGIIRRAKEEFSMSVSFEDYDFLTIAHYKFVNQAIDHLMMLEDVIDKAIIGKDPSKVANWVFDLAQLFMKVYDEISILRAPDTLTRKSSLLIIEGIRRGIETGLDILGIPAAQQL